MDNKMATFQSISNSIRQDATDYKGYLALGDYYKEINGNKAFLCYENALFFSERFSQGEQRGRIEEEIRALQNKGVAVPKTAFVILSYNQLDMTRECLESIRRTTSEEMREIIIVDNASVDGSANYLSNQMDIKVILNEENKGFPIGCNQGIEIAEQASDILLLNNDTVLCENSLFWLRMGLYEDSSIGAAGSVSNAAPYGQTIIERGKSREEYLAFGKQNNVPMDNPIEYKALLIGFALMVKRPVLEKIGRLNEIYTPGYYEDNDICVNVLKAGYQPVAVHNSFIIHWGDVSFGKRPDQGAVIARNHELFDRTYGMASLETMHINYRIVDFARMAGLDSYESGDVLEISCGIGATLAHLKYRYPKLNFWGIDNHLCTAAIGANWKSIHVDSYEDIRLHNLRRQFDFIIMEYDEREDIELSIYLEEMEKLLKPGGKVLLIIRNIRYYKNWLPIITEGRVPITNEKYIPREEAETMLTQNGLSVSSWYFSFGDIREETSVKEAIELFADKLPGFLGRDMRIQYFGILAGK